MKQKHTGSFLTGSLKRNQLKKHLELIICRLFLSGFDFVSQQAKTSYDIAPSWFDPENVSSQHKCISRYLTFNKKCNKYGILRYQIFSVQRNMFWNYHKYILPSASLTCARSREKQGNVNADPTANASPPPPSNLINDDDQDDYDNYQDHPDAEIFERYISFFWAKPTVIVFYSLFWKAGLREWWTFKVKKKKITLIDSNSPIF